MPVGFHPYRRGELANVCQWSASDILDRASVHSRNVDDSAAFVSDGRGGALQVKSPSAGIAGTLFSEGELSARECGRPIDQRLDGGLGQVLHQSEGLIGLGAESCAAPDASDDPQDDGYQLPVHGDDSLRDGLWSGSVTESFSGAELRSALEMNRTKPA